MKYIQYFLTLMFLVVPLFEIKQAKAAPVCAANHLDLTCDPDTEYVWFRVNHCYAPTPNPNSYVDHIAECRSKPSNACIPRVETNSPTNISGTACGSGGTYWCDRPDDGAPVSWRCFCVGCGSPPATCDTHTRTIDVTAIPLQVTLINTRDSACGGNPDLPAESTYDIDVLPYILPSGSSVPELNLITNSFIYTWQTSAASPPSCPAPATLTCPDGSTVTRNAYPTCDFPACPAQWLICIERVKQTLTGNCMGIANSMSYSQVTPGDCSGHTNYMTSSACPPALPDPPGQYHYDHQFNSQLCIPNGSPAIDKAYCCSGHKVGALCAP